MSERGTPRVSYTTAFKLRVIAYAVSNGNRAASRQFSVDESCVRRWKLQRERLLKTPRNKRAQRYRPTAFPDIEKELAVWITEKRQGGIGVSTNVICLKAKSVAQKFGIAEESFKASKRWCYGFMECYGFSIRRRTTIAQKLPQDYEEKLIKFQCYVIAQRKKHDFELKYIGNADQDWMLADQHTFTPSGRIRKVELDQICQWIVEAWEDIPIELIKKSFRKCCITNALDGTEDDEMWDEDDDDSDPFAGINDDDDDADLHYAGSYEREQADIDPEGYQNLFGDSDSEDFYRF